MQTHNLKRTHKNPISRQVGRGGKRGKTSGRGTKGQKARSGHKIRPELRDMIKRIPKLRGRGKNSFKTIETKPVPVNLALIEKHFANGDTVTPALLVEKRLAYRQNGKTPRIKILGTGDFSKKISFSDCEFSLPAKEKVQKAGGSVL